MFSLISRLGRAIAVAAATISLIVLGAAPARAIEHFLIDRDSVVLGASSSNSYKAFDGDLEIYHDGSRIRGEVDGTFVGRGAFFVIWRYHDGSTSESPRYSTSGVQRDISVESRSDRDLVRAEFYYDASTATDDKLVRYVGDDPDSKGTCTQLDYDPYSFARDGFSFEGSTLYRCDPSTGTVTARIRGTLTGPAGGDWSLATVRATYRVPGTSLQGGDIAVVRNRDGERQVYIDTTTPLDRDVYTVQLALFRNGVGDGPVVFKHLGDG